MAKSLLRTLFLEDLFNYLLCSAKMASHPANVLLPTDENSKEKALREK